MSTCLIRNLLKPLGLDGLCNPTLALARRHNHILSDLTDDIIALIRTMRNMAIMAERQANRFICEFYEEWHCTIPLVGYSTAGFLPVAILLK